MKLVLVLVLLGCATFAIADDCDVLEGLKVKNQWNQAFGEGTQRLEFSTDLWHDFFEEHPDARALFSRVHGDNIYSDEFKAHGQRVLSGLDLTIGDLDDEDVLKAQLAHLHTQHADRNVKPEYWDYFLHALLEDLYEHLGIHLDWEAWTHCFKHIAEGIK